MQTTEEEKERAGVQVKLRLFQKCGVASEQRWAFLIAHVENVSVPRSFPRRGILLSLPSLNVQGLDLWDPGVLIQTLQFFLTSVFRKNTANIQTQSKNVEMWVTDARAACFCTPVPPAVFLMKSLRKCLSVCQFLCAHYNQCFICQVPVYFKYAAM